MFSYKLKTLVIIFITGLLIGAVSSLLFTGCNTGKSSPVASIVPAKDLKKQADNSFAFFQKEIAGLQVKNQQLTKELHTTKVLLTQAKQQTAKRASKIKELTRPKGFPAKELLQKIEIADYRQSSTSPCDSLAQEVTAYVQENAVKDSLYEAQIVTLDSSLTVKDSIIAMQHHQQKELYILFEQSLLQQELLASENKQLRKQAKRQKLKSTLKTIGLIVLSSVATRYLTGR